MIGVRAVALGLFAMSQAVSGSTGAIAGEVQKPLSYVEIRYASVVRQQFDFSCGAATLATILSFYWGRPTDEIEVMNVLRARYPGSDWANLQKRGFSVDDLIWAADKLGFAGQGAQLPAAELAKIDGPVIVHLDKGKFQHFSVVRLVRAGRVYLADTVLGAVSISLAEFEQQYTGSAVAIWKKGMVLPKGAILGRPVAAIDSSQTFAEPGAMPLPQINPMLGR